MTVMRRAIAGVNKGSGRNRRARGNVVEMTPEAKTELAVKHAMANHSDWFDNWKDCMAWCTELLITSSRYSAKGNPLKGKWANNTYTARGSLKAHLQSDDKIFEARAKEFDITFIDSLDGNGIPDLTVEKFTVTPL